MVHDEVAIGARSGGCTPSRHSRCRRKCAVREEPTITLGLTRMTGHRGVRANDLLWNREFSRRRCPRH
ncbi:hypothetical protein ACFFX0_31990 [Citricoccus parietis]|uniref:Uncharacterized protein n=1 Tax=Citricoccus parietis TaxID=592307 RepID=A0ABV5G997_9MICC